MEKFIVTGNDYISLPTITPTGDIQDVGFLCMQARGLFSLSGLPFLRAFVKRNGVALNASSIKETKLAFWIPQFEKQYEHGVAVQTVFTPMGSKGFMMRIDYRNTSDCTQKITLGFQGEWENTTREINASDTVFTEKILTKGWFDAPVYALNGDLPLFCFSFLCDKTTKNDFLCEGKKASYRMQKETLLSAGESTSLTLAVGFGVDGVSAITGALDCLRQGFENALQSTLSFLEKRIVKTGNPAADFQLNYNLFFCYFFSGGRTLDTEQFITVTSRSPRYYVSAAYWDRDSLLWAFPAILAVDTHRAKEILQYAFTTQIRNVGEHSRFIDGTLLEPGFELDELIAPIVALCDYLDKTNDSAFLQSDMVQNGIAHILEKLQTKKHPDLYLYETFLYPSDDMRAYPYLTYDNALLAHALERLGKAIESNAYTQLAKKIRNAIFKHCVTVDNGKKVFVWCCDLQGNYQLYDEPPGSLILLARLGLCEVDDEIYVHTRERLYADGAPYVFSKTPFHELGCAHAAHPWVLSYCNRILSGKYTEDTILQMLTMPMDNGLACESIDEYTGEAKTGEAFATCAGLYAYALMQVFGK